MFREERGFALVYKKANPRGCKSLLLKLEKYVQSFIICYIKLDSQMCSYGQLLGI